MAAEKSALKTQRKSFRGEIMYIWKGFDIQHHLSDAENKYDVFSLFVSMIAIAEVLYRMSQKSIGNRSFTPEVPYIRQKQAYF